MLVERVKVTPVKHINKINSEKISEHIDSALSICYSGKYINKKRTISRGLTIAKFLLISQTNLKLRINFGPNTRIVIKIILGTKSKLCHIITGIPSQINGTFQVRFYFMINGGTKFTAVIPT